MSRRAQARTVFRMERAEVRAEKLWQKTATPEERAVRERQIEQSKIFAARKRENSFTYLPARTGWSVVKPGPLTPIGKEFQQIVLARDWDMLFTFLPVEYWGKRDTLGKYSFEDRNGVRTWIPFSEDDIRRFVFSPYYTVQPGWTCTDAQRELGVAANLKGMVRHGQKFRNTDPRRMWPIFPGWGYEDSGQRYGCEKGKKSLWVKIRGAVAIAVAVVAAVYLGPIIAEKAAALGASSSSAATGGVATEAATKATLFSKIKSGTTTVLKYVNKARTIKAVVNGELPPPPIGITGSTFTEWAISVAKEEIKKAAIEKAMETGIEYIQKKMTAREEAKLRAEIEAMQKELARITPANTPMQPMVEVPKDIQAKMAEEKEQSKEINNVLGIAIPIGLAYLAFV